MKIGETKILDVERLTGTLDGVCHADGIVVFVPKALPGERVRVVIEKTAPRYAHARLIEVLLTSPLRQNPPCAVYDRCGGCCGLHMPYAETLRSKAEGVRETLRRLGGINVETPPIFGMDVPYNYRNKTVFQVDCPRVGFFDAHRVVVDVASCALQSVSANVVLPIIRAHGTGLKSVMMRENRAGECVVVVSTPTRDLPQRDALIAALREGLPRLTGVMHNVNPRVDGDALLGEIHTLWGETTLSDSILGLNFRVAPQAFFQVNARQTDVLYQTALNMLKPQAHETAIDAYCGTGTITLLLAQSVRLAIGVEINAAAIESARVNATLNDVHNATFYQGAVERLLPDLMRTHKPAFVTLDPPRAGCDRAFIDALIKNPPPCVVYISCDPATLARDLRLLSAVYAIKDVKLVDMFCLTAHVEAVALLERQ